MEGVLIMAANTKALPRMDMSISGALRTQFMMTIVSGIELPSLSYWWSADPLLSLSVLVIINVGQNSELDFTFNRKQIICPFRSSKVHITKLTEKFIL